MKMELEATQQLSAAGLIVSQKPAFEERSWQGSGIEGLLPSEVTNLAAPDSRQPSPAPRLNDFSATSTSTELDAEGKPSLGAE